MIHVIAYYVHLLLIQLLKISHTPIIRATNKTVIPIVGVIILILAIVNDDIDHKSHFTTKGETVTMIMAI